MYAASIVALVIFLYSLEVSGSQYTPKGLYDPEYFTLPNGLDVVLKHRDVTHNTAIRLSVKVGQLDFECGRQEVPHFLEHLLFTGTSQHSQAELEALIEEHGGYWNAYTKAERTDYEIDIYSIHALLAIDVLHEIITDSQMMPSDVARTRDIIHRELGGKPSKVKEWLYRRGIVRDAMDNAFLKMFPNSNVVCPKLQTADHINRKNVLDVFNRYYVPNNMLLVIVGEFDRTALMEKIKATFGMLQPKELKNGHREPPEYYRSGPSVSSGNLSPVFDSGANLGLAFRTDGNLSPDRHPLLIIDEYLGTRLFNTLRVAWGLSYGPQSTHITYDTFGVFLLSTDVDTDDIDTALGHFYEEIDILRKGEISNDEIEKAKKRILLSWVQGFESNSDIADYYLSKHHELTRYGRLINHEEKLERITPDDVKAVARLYFDDSTSVIIKDTPTFSDTQLFALVSLLILAALFIMYRIFRRLRARRAHALHVREESI